MGSLRQNVKMEDDTDAMIDKSKLPVGMYVVNMTYQDKRIESKKLIVLE